MNEMLWVAALVSAPILISTLVVGVLISVIQVATQIQEMTISYVPKLAVAALILILLGGWMMGRIGEFARQSYASISTIR
jgi:flagellar biosynthetic protein FliQ